MLIKGGSEIQISGADLGAGVRFREIKLGCWSLYAGELGFGAFLKLITQNAKPIRRLVRQVDRSKSQG